MARKAMMISLAILIAGAIAALAVCPSTLDADKLGVCLIVVGTAMVALGVYGIHKNWGESKN